MCLHRYIKTLETEVEDFEKKMKDEHHKQEHLMKALNAARQNASQVEIYQANSSSLRDRLSSNKNRQQRLHTEIEALKAQTTPFKKEHTRLQR